MECPKCGHLRTPEDDPATPADQCPACGIYYQKYLNRLAAEEARAITDEDPPPAESVAIASPAPEPAIEQTAIELPTQTDILQDMAECARHRTSHLLHLVLSVLSVGAWSFIWLLVSARNVSQRNRIHRRYHVRTERNEPQILINFLIALAVGLLIFRR